MTRKLIITAFFSLFSSIAFTQTTLILEPTEFALIGYHDNYNTANSNYNWGDHFAGISQPGFQGGLNHARGLIKFDLSQIPVGATIVSVKMDLYGRGPTGTAGPSGQIGNLGQNECYLERITTTWNENTVTWNTAPQYTSQNQVLLPSTSLTIADYLDIDVTNLALDMIANPGSSHGFMIRLVNQSPTRALIFCSTSYPDSTKHPRLKVEYIMPSPCGGTSITLYPQRHSGIGYHDGYNSANVNQFSATHFTAGSQPGQNWGENNHRSLVEFDYSQIPAGATIISATLDLFGHGPFNTTGAMATVGHIGPAQAYFERIITPWNEYTVTWNTQPQTTALNRVTVDSATAPIQDFLGIDITNLVIDAINNPVTSHGYMFRLAVEDPTRGLAFCSNQHPDSTKHLRVNICYTLCTPLITTQPINQQANFGNTVQFQVATQSSNATYQWQSDLGSGFVNLTNAGQYSGVNTAILQVSNVQAANDQQTFRCIVNDGNCPDTSDVAVLMLTPCGYTSLVLPITEDVPIGVHDNYPSASTNYGSSHHFSAGFQAGYQGGVNFWRVLFNTDFSQIPAGAQIISAKLNLYGIGPLNSWGAASTVGNIGQNACYIQRATSPWLENVVTWNTQPSVTTVNQVTLPQSTQIIQDYLDIDITTLVVDMLNSGNHYGFVMRLINEAPTTLLAFCSSDYTDSTKHPWIEICYDFCAPLITTQPINQQANFGNTVQFQVATQSSNATYQWQSDLGSGFVNLTNAGQYSGVNTAILQVSNVQAANDQQTFRCIVNDGNCPDTSDVAVLTTQCILSLGQQPANQLSAIGDSAVFMVSASVAGAVYQWQSDMGTGFQDVQNSAQYSGANDSILIVYNVLQSNNNQQFRCIVQANNCIDTSQVALLQIYCGRIITEQPLSPSIYVGGIGIFEVVTASPNANYQWQTNLGFGFQNLSNAGQYSGVTTSILTVSNVTAANNNQLFRCSVTYEGCMDTTDVAVLNVIGISVEELNVLDFKIYPNPTRDYLVVEHNELIDNEKYLIRDIIGNEIARGYLSEEYSIIDIKSLAAGTYIFTLRGNALRFVVIE